MAISATVEVNSIRFLFLLASSLCAVTEKVEIMTELK